MSAGSPKTSVESEFQKWRAAQREREALDPISSPPLLYARPLRAPRRLKPIGRLAKVCLGAFAGLSLVVICVAVFPGWLVAAVVVTAAAVLVAMLPVLLGWARRVKNNTPVVLLNLAAFGFLLLLGMAAATGEDQPSAAKMLSRRLDMTDYAPVLAILCWLVALVWASAAATEKNRTTTK